ncbi:MAG: 16S rRNA (cytosine(1402)-N(4))-methyltransferase RsmH [Candidatus Sericytochromatia bacterium]
MIGFEHKPVLLKEVMLELDCKENGVYLDCTTGGAGHSSEILQKIGATGYLYGIDRDINALNHAKSVLDKISSNYKLIKSDYSSLPSIFEQEQLFDGILFDLGVSSPQLDNSERGFSFSKEAMLDMRLDQDENTATARTLINKLTKDELVEIFSKYGEEPYSKTIADFIVKERKVSSIETTTQLSELIIRALAGKKYKGKIHPATRVFQALRIKVNNELEGIKETLPYAINLLKPKGRLAVISFHSLEDRIVKETFRAEEKGCDCPPKQPVCLCGRKSKGKIITKKPIIASEDEIKLNSRARSAKLRVFEKN